MNGLLVSVYMFRVSFHSVTDNQFGCVLTLLLGLIRFWCMQAKQNMYVINFYQSCYAYHSICIEWIWALLQLLFDTRDDSMRSFARWLTGNTEKSTPFKKGSG